MANVIGHVYPNEAFVFLGVEGGIVDAWMVNTAGKTIAVYDDVGGTGNEAIMFFNGSFKQGYMDCTGCSRLYDAAAQYTRINNSTYAVLTLRRKEEIYDGSGNLIGNMLAGSNLAIDSSRCGSTKPYLLNYDYYKAGSSSTWSPVSGTRFIDTGAREYGCESNWSIKY